MQIETDKIVESGRLTFHVSRRTRVFVMIKGVRCLNRAVLWKVQVWREEHRLHHLPSSWFVTDCV